jgi:tetratricopeptide (TPR) repeat protein
LTTAWSWIVRILVVAVCGVLTAWSLRMTVADWRAQSNGMAGLESAIRLEPGDSVLVARAALAKNEYGDMSAEVDRELLRAAELNPFDAKVQMALGLREEFRGHLAEAERYLVHATEIDHTFKPAWTLANFYVRQDQAEKMWPVIKRGLALNPLVFDPRPVFDLCWNESGDSKKILELIPGQGRVPLQYLFYLFDTKRSDAALEVWPRARDAEDQSDPFYVEVTIRFVEFLQMANRLADAVSVWNQLVDRGVVVSGKLNPAAGGSIADPDFNFPLLDRGFEWHVIHQDGVSVAKAALSLRFEFDGNEPEAMSILGTVAPLLPGRAYRLVWKTDASELSARKDPGFAWQVVQEPGGVATMCQPLLQAGDDGSCQFTSLPTSSSARLDLMYRRATGTTRVEGMLRIANVKLELGS